MKCHHEWDDHRCTEYLGILQGPTGMYLSCPECASTYALTTERLEEFNESFYIMLRKFIYKRAQGMYYVPVMLSYLDEYPQAFLKQFFKSYEDRITVSDDDTINIRRD